jgi:hypothetical protein
MRSIGIAILLAALLGACGGAPTASVTAQGVIDRLAAAGVEVTGVQPGTREADSPLPNSYTEHLTFTIPSLGDRGGQVFVCSTKQNCDALYAYFDALKSLGGPYYYQSPSGTVVMQLNNALTPDAAAQFESVMKALP